MGKISKYSNLYDKDGKLIRSVDSVSGRKDETKRTEYTNSMSVLMHMYETKGNPHKDEIVNKINEYVKTKTTKAEVINALNDIKDEETGKDGSSTEGRVPDTSERAGKRRRRSSSNETDTTISTAA
jgi:hypothetical protein